MPCLQRYKLCMCPTSALCKPARLRDQDGIETLVLATLYVIHYNQSFQETLCPRRIKGFSVLICPLLLFRACQLDISFSEQTNKGVVFAVKLSVSFGPSLRRWLLRYQYHLHSIHCSQSVCTMSRLFIVQDQGLFYSCLSGQDLWQSHDQHLSSFHTVNLALSR